MNKKCKRCGCIIEFDPDRPLDGNGPIHIGSDTYCYDCYLELCDKYADHDEPDYEYEDELAYDEDVYDYDDYE